MVFGGHSQRTTVLMGMPSKASDNLFCCLIWRVCWKTLVLSYIKMISDPHFIYQYSAEFINGGRHSVSCASLAFSFLATPKSRSYFSSHLPSVRATNKSSRQMRSHIALFTAVQRYIFFPPPQCPVAIHVGLTSRTTCTPHSTPATPIVSLFGPLTVWQLCFAKLTLSAV